jgi:hypothetical protein
MGVILALLIPALCRAEDSHLSPQRLDWLDQRGYFTPNFKRAAHDLVDAKEALAKAKSDQAALQQSLPALHDQVAQEQAKLTALQKELALYAHPEDADFDALQKAMKDPSAKPEQQLELAQAFVWSYPTDPHQTEAEQDLRQIQKTLADQQEAARQAEAARIAARAQLLQRAQAHDLSISEWQTFLQDMSQEDLLKTLGRPQSVGDGFWTYPTGWTQDPVTGRKAGLQINFNGTRVLSASVLPATGQ